MNKIEFTKTLNMFGQSTEFSHTKSKLRTEEEVYLWKGLLINFSGTYYAIVQGKVPYEVAQRIYKKYPNNEYGIRIDGGYINSKPGDYVTDDQYKSEINQYIKKQYDAEEFLSNCQKSKNALLERSDDEKYIDLYHIDTFEGLIILMTEMLDYFNRKNNIPETEVSKTNDYIKQIYQEMIEYVDPNISIYEWMNTDSEVSDDFNQIISLNYETSLGRQFRNTLDEFDAAVNPYTNYTLKEIELDDLENYLKRVSLEIIPFTMKDGEYREYCCSIEIKDKNSGNFTRHIRNPHGFSNNATFKIKDNHLFQVIHFYNQSGENISIGHYGKDCENRMEIRYNISLGTIKVSGFDSRMITPHEFGIILDELSKAIELAKEVTISNMKKRENVMVLK